MAYQPLTVSRGPTRASMVSDAADELLGQRVAGNSPALRARSQGMNEAMAGAARTARATANQSAARAGVGLQPGAMRRAAQRTNEDILSELGSSQLQQTQLAAEDQDRAMQQGIARGAQERGERFQNLQALAANAANIGDTTTSAALQDLFLGDAGSQYTDIGRSRMAEDVAAARDEAAWLRSQQDKYQGPNVPGSGKSWWKSGLKGAAGGAMAAAPTGNPYAIAGGGVLGGLAGIFS